MERFKGIVTLSRFMLEEKRNLHKDASGAFTELLFEVAFAAKVVAREVNKAGLVEILGLAGDENVHGEDVTKLDVYANRVFQHALDHTGLLCTMASEEEDNIIEIPDKFPLGQYVFVFDPLDGSSNIDANVSIGSIFAIYRRITPRGKGTAEDCLQPGNRILAAGYVIYGSSNMFVYSTGHGVHGFTLDPSIGEFILSHEDIKVPENPAVYSVNEANYHKWDEPIKKFIEDLKSNKTPDGSSITARYIGSLVADFHRNLLYGGIFFYPPDSKNKNGKLRLLYEANPLAYIIEQAGGYASDGYRRILDKVPTSIHERTPLYIGNTNIVKLAENYLNGAK
ncbi:MAG: class 1 fructose-bisphosphatase [Planctomycetota bacterium]